MARQRIVRIKSGKRVVYYRDTISGEITESQNEVVKDTIKPISLINNEPLPEFWSGLVGHCECRKELSRYRGHCKCKNKDIVIKECLKCEIKKDLVSIRDSEDISEPTLLKKAINYQAAIRHWIAAGRPTRTQEEIDNIHKTHCKGCLWRDAQKDVCKGCGCPVTTNGFALLNKIAMATEHCPRKLW